MSATSFRVSVTLLAVSVPALLACSKTEAPAPPIGPPAAATADPQFDRRWADLASKGVETLYVEDDRGQGLMGNVRRAANSVPPAPPPPPAAAGAPAAENAPLPAEPRGDDVDKVIRQNLAAVKSCYLVAARTGRAASGKAIVSFTIGADGQVTEVKVDAPAFTLTGLGRCMTAQVNRWAFPRSEKGLAQVSYPFVFVGS